MLLLLVLAAEINSSQLEAGGLRISLRFFTPQQLSIKNKVHLKDLVFHSEFQKEIQRRLESQKEKKRKEE